MICALLGQNGHGTRPYCFICSIWPTGKKVNTYKRICLRSQYLQISLKLVYFPEWFCLYYSVGDHLENNFHHVSYKTKNKKHDFAPFFSENEAATKIWLWSCRFIVDTWCMLKKLVCYPPIRDRAAMPAPNTANHTVGLTLLQKKSPWGSESNQWWLSWRHIFL